MKNVKVVSIRHGKTTPAVNNNDAGRVLTEKGHDDVVALGKQLARLSVKAPSKIVFSSAKRAQQTGYLILEQLDGPHAQPRLASGLYAWEELLEAAAEPDQGGMGFSPRLAVYEEKFPEALHQFEQNRIKALLEAVDGPHAPGELRASLDEGETLLTVSHAWVANTSIMPFMNGKRKLLREYGIPEAHALVLYEDGKLICVGPDGIVDLETLKA